MIRHQLLRRSCRTLVGAMLVLVAAPAMAFTCTLANPESNEVPVQAADVRVPIRHESARAAWRIGSSSWQSVRPQVWSGVLVAGRSERRYGVAYRQQQRLEFVVFGRRFAVKYIDDQDDATPSCALAGEFVWTRPRLLIRETPAAVFATFITRRTPGDTTGCATYSTGGAGCEDSAFGRHRLAAPLGDRRLVLDWFPREL